MKLGDKVVLLEEKVLQNVRRYKELDKDAETRKWRVTIQCTRKQGS